MEVSERKFLRCESGPAIGHTVTFPPPLEFDADGGGDVLIDDGPPEEWRYEFVAKRR